MRSHPILLSVLVGFILLFIAPFLMLYGHGSTFLMIYGHGNNINQAEEDGATLLYRACQIGHVNAVNMLLTRKEIQINQAANDGATPLYIACWTGYVEVVNALLARKEIQINQATNNGVTPLYIACYYGHVKVAKVLLANKEIDINKAFVGQPPLTKALQQGHTEIVALLQQHARRTANSWSKF